MLASPRRRNIDRATLSKPATTLALLTILAAILRIAFLTSKSLYMDEANSVAIAQLHLSNLVRMIASREANMALYFVFLHYWLHTGTGEFALRIPSAVFSVATVPVLYALAKRSFDTHIALIAALLLSLNAFHLESAQNARSYGLLLLLVTSSDLLLLRAIELPNLQRCGAYVAATVLALYAHFFTLLLVASHAGFLIVARLPQAVRRRLYFSEVAIIISSIPIVLFIVFRNTGQLDWVPKTEPLMLVDLFTGLSGGGYASPNVTAGLIVERMLQIITAIFMVTGLLISARGSHTQGRERLEFLATRLFVPVICVLAVSIAVQPIFFPRYLEICLPPFLILTAAGIDFIGARSSLAVCLCLVAALGMYEDVSYYKYFERADFRDAVDYIAIHRQADDGAIIYTPDERWPFEYYCSHLAGGLKCPEIVFPGLNTRFWIGGPYATDSAPEIPSKEFLMNLPWHYRRIWLVLYEEDAVSGDIKVSLGQHYTLAMEREFVDLRLLLYGPPKEQGGCFAGSRWKH